MVFEIAIGSSDKTNANEAIIEAINKSIKKITHKPTFILFYATIHYQNDFNKMIKEINNNALNTPIIGCSVAGFIDNTGCYNRGIVILACYSDEINVKAVCSQNTKRNPVKAAENAFSLIKEKLNNDFKNNVLFLHVSGPTIPNFPFIGKKWTIKSKLLSLISVPALDFSTIFFQAGYGREEEVLRKLAELMPETFIFGGSSSDDNRVLKNFIFYNEKIMQNSLAALLINSNKKVSIISKHGLIFSGKKFNATKTHSNGRIISELNKNSATKIFLNELNLSEEMMDERLHRKTWFFPLVFRNSENNVCPAAIGVYFKDSIALAYGIENNELELAWFSGQSMLKSVNEIKEFIIKEKPVFSLGIICCSWLETLGRRIYIIHDILKEAFKEKPFLALFVLGEDIKLPYKKPIHLNETINFITFS